jgi:superfamily I DNA/RNA helicase
MEPSGWYMALDGRDRLQLQRLAASLNNLLAEFNGLAPAPLVRRVISTLRIPLPEPTSSWEPQREALRAFVAMAQEWRQDVSSLLDQWVILREESLWDPRADRISLSTIHAAKGLEFSVVFVVGCEEGVFPYGGRDADLEEERRLFFVAITRAKDLLYLTRAGSRRIRPALQPAQPSRFLEEVPPEFREAEGDPPIASAVRPPRQLKLF